MTEENNEPKITSVEKTSKVKDPKRVEAGKRLAAISKMAKEKKMLERLNMKKHTHSEEEDDSNMLAYGVAAAGLLVCGCVLYNRYKKPITDEPKEVPEVTPTTSTKRTLYTFD